MENKTREEKLEAAFLQLLELTVKHRLREKKWHEHFGYQNRQALKASQDSIDKMLEQMQVDDTTDFKNARIII